MEKGIEFAREACFPYLKYEQEPRRVWAFSSTYYGSFKGNIWPSAGWLCCEEPEAIDCVALNLMNKSCFYFYIINLSYIVVVYVDL